MITGSYPNTRLRRNRKAAWVRDLLAENTINASDLILPLFIQEGKNRSNPIKSMPDVYRHSIDKLLEQVKIAHGFGIKAIALFPATPQELKSADAKEAFNPDNLVCRAIRAIKKEIPDLGIICDVALDPYTTHGHDGIIINDKIDNDATIEILCQQAIVQAKAGCDIVAPSDMMDGRVGAIRTSLDSNKLQDISILAYAAKYASAFYGPFRDAVGSNANLGKSDKRTYQMDYRNSKEALHEVALDIAEGADIIMVKPALPYLDIIKDVKDNFPVPIFAYQVSGEYAMLKAAAENGWLDFEKTMFESLIACKRAGASAILTYAALEVARVIN